ncbi:lysozyme inhibitor LprI family protein [Shewanella aestuarii]|uniref:DUF1311 domain-containing protein n=1 Tax=Shewanella aestuarii TaxID=1028752 RepID=A0A6G9QHD1_9GAMM|nr:lysozyme inhibitor LprI family protein [Shewanella aestuarii]QIR13563.1 DUF1311 domain-containing protein [Shewanella aestuarii]
MKPLLSPSLTIVTLSLSPYLFAASPTFDCAKAQGEVEQLICQSDELSQLDQQLLPLYRQVLSLLDEQDAKVFKAKQRGWIKGRNDCWKANDKNQCIQYEYQIRLTELQIASASVEVPAKTLYQCADQRLITAYFYNNTAIAAVVFTVSGPQLTPTQPHLGLIVPSASGAKYQA